MCTHNMQRNKQMKKIKIKTPSGYRFLGWLNNKCQHVLPYWNCSYGHFETRDLLKSFVPGQALFVGARLWVKPLHRQKLSTGSWQQKETGGEPWEADRPGWSCCNEEWEAHCPLRKQNRNKRICLVNNNPTAKEISNIGTIMGDGSILLLNKTQQFGPEHTSTFFLRKAQVIQYRCWNDCCI